MTATIEIGEDDEAPVRRTARLSDIARVLIYPISTFAKHRSPADAAKLFLLVLAIDFILSLLLLPTFSHNIVATLASKGATGPQMRVAALGVALISGSIANATIVSLTAVLFFIAQMILVGRGSFSETVGALLVASAPVILDRMLRVGGYALGLFDDPLTDPFSFARLGWLHGQSGWRHAVGFLSVFDLWTFALVVVGFPIATRMRWIYSLPMSLLFWGGLQALLLRLQLDGALGS